MKAGYSKTTSIKNRKHEGLNKELEKKKINHDTENRRNKSKKFRSRHPVIVSGSNRNQRAFSSQMSNTPHRNNGK